MGDDEEGGGIGTFVSAILILLVITGVIYVVFFLMYGGSKGALEETFTDVKKISDEVYNTEKDIGVKESNKIADYLEGIFSIKEKDCLMELDFNSFDKDFIIEFNNNALTVFKKEGNTNRYVAVKRLLNNVYFNKDIKNFKIKEFKEIETSESNYNIPLFDNKIILYRSLNGDFNFMDSFKNALFKGFFSEIFEKNMCGWESKKRILTITNVNFDIIPGTTEEEARDLSDYLNSDFSYLGTNYKIYEMIKYLFDLNGQKDRLDFPIEKEFNNLLVEMSNHIENYFGETYRGLPNPSENKCWRAYIEEGSSSLFFGNSKGQNLLYRKATITLSNGDIINFRLYVSKDDCLPAIKINMLLGH